MYEGFGTTSLIIIIILVVVVIFLLRELVTWYFKINSILKSLDKTNQLLESLIRVTDSITIPKTVEKEGNAFIKITGNSDDNYVLSAAIEESGQFQELKEKPDNEAELKYITIKQARNALSEAYGRLCGAEPDIIGERDGITIFDDTLYYKKSKAEITL